MYPNIEEDNVELAQLNAEIDKVKKQLAARQSKYEEVPQPKTQVGWSSYIVNNDRGMLDKYQDAERQWYTLKEQERHAKELADEQARNTRELADKQRAQQDILNMDENMKNRAIAAANYQYAVAAREADTSGDKEVKAMLKQKEAEAKATLDYWNKRAGFNSDGTKTNNVSLTNTPATNTEDSDEGSDDNGSTTEVQIGDYEAIKSFKTQAEKAATLTKMEAHPAMKNNDRFKAQYRRLKGITPNDVKAEQVAKWRKEYEALKPSRQREWKELNPDKAKAIGV